MRAATTDPTSEATAFLAELGDRGLRLRPLPDGRIGIRPAADVDAETAARIRAMRGALRDLLLHPRTWACIRCERFRFARPTVCYWCQRAEERPARA